MDHVKYLLENHFPIDIDSPDGLFPLHIAAIKGNAEIMKLLINKQSDVNCLTLDRVTPLHYAVESGCYEAVKILIENGAILRADDNRRTPLDIIDSVDSPDKEKIKILLDELNDKKKAESYIEQNEEQFIDLCNEKPILVKRFGGSFLVSAAKHNMQRIIQYLIKQGIDVNSIERETIMSPLHYCAQNNNENLVSFLIQNGAKLTKSKDGKTALDLTTSDIVKLMLGATFMNEKVSADVACAALKNNRIPLLLVILESKGFDINSYNEKGKTLLTTAVSTQNSALLKIILTYSPDLSKQTRNGLTALHISAIRDDIEIAEELIRRCSPILTDRFGKKPIDYAKSDEMKELLSKYEEIKQTLDTNQTDKDNVKALVKQNKKNVSVYGPLLAFEAIKHQSEHSLKFLLLHGVSPNTKNQYGEGLMHYAASLNYIQGAILLLQSSANINLKNKEGATPLHIACAKGNDVFAELLIVNGADLNAQAKGGMTPLMIATRSHCKRIVNLLLDKGANEDLKNVNNDDYNDLKKKKKRIKLLIQDEENH